MSFRFQLFQRNTQWLELLANVIFLILVLEIILQTQARAEFLENPQRRFAFTERRDNRLTNEYAIADDGEWIVAFEVRRFGQNDIAEPCGIVHRRIHRDDEIEFTERLQRFAAFRQRRDWILPMDEPASV